MGANDLRADNGGINSMVGLPPVGGTHNGL